MEWAYAMKHGSDWYKREPTAYLGGVQGMSSKEHAVYSIIIDLIYQHGGSVNDDPAWFAGWVSDMSPAAVRKAIASLIERGKLERDGDQLTNKRAKSEAKTKENLRETRGKHGKKGGVYSGVSRSALNDNNGLSEANALPREEKIREEIGKIQADACTKSSQRLSKDFYLPRDWGEWAVSEGWPEDAVRTEAMKFKDYWISKSGRDAIKLDWLPTWRNWMRNSKSTNSQQKGNKPNGRDIADRVAARFDQMGSGEDTNPAVSLFPARHAIGRD